MTGKDPKKTEALSKFISERLAALSLSPNEASQRAGLGRDAIRDIMRGSAPGANKLRAIAQVLGVSADALLNLSAKPQEISKSVVDVPPVSRFHTGPADLMLKRPTMSADGSFADISVTEIARPAELQGRSEGYAIYVTDDLNFPLIRPGHIAYIDPSRPVSAGHLVRVMLVAGAPYLGTLEALTVDYVLVRVAAEPAPRRHESGSVHKIERVVAVSLIDA